MKVLPNSTLELYEKIWKQMKAEGEVMTLDQF